MNMLKNVRLTPHARNEVWCLWQMGVWKKDELSDYFRVSEYPIKLVMTIYEFRRQQ